MKNDFVKVVQTVLKAQVGWLIVFLCVKSVVLVGRFVITEGISMRVWLAVSALSLLTTIMSLE